MRFCSSCCLLVIFLRTKYHADFPVTVDNITAQFCRLRTIKSSFYEKITGFKTLGISRTLPGQINTIFTSTRQSVETVAINHTFSI